MDTSARGADAAESKTESGGPGVRPQGRAAVVRICVVDSPELGPAYPRLAESTLEIMAIVPAIHQLDPRLLVEHDAVVLACSVAELVDPSFQRAAAPIARHLPTIALAQVGADAAIAARLGFRGFLDRDVPPEALDRTVRSVLSGELAFPRSSLTRMFELSSIVPTFSPNEGPLSLTLREQQIVELIAQGATDREIGVRLQISQSTAHKHVQNALRKSKARTRSQLVAVIRQAALQ
jgi:DNA-binding NarL/FixJ family response regulator